MGEAERAGSRLREARGRVRLDLGVEWMICNRGVWAWEWEWENVEEKVKVKGAG
jgi:predicted peroxiredoxin